MALVELMKEIGDVPLPSRPCQLCQREMNGKSNVGFSDGHVVCLPCLNRYLYAAIAEGRVQLACPVPNCPNQLSNDLVVEFLTTYQPQLLPKWNSAGRRHDLLPQANVLWCPAPLCSGMTTSTNRGKVLCTQADCQTLICGNCRAKWHRGNCQAPSKRTQLCPRCGTNASGNLSQSTKMILTCPTCLVNFCWKCRQVLAWEDTHYRDAQTCPLTKWVWQWPESQPLKGLIYGLVLLWALLIAIPLGLAFSFLWPDRVWCERRQRSGKPVATLWQRGLFNLAAFIPACVLCPLSLSLLVGWLAWQCRNPTKAFSTFEKFCDAKF